jgi:arginine repressor
MAKRAPGVKSQAISEYLAENKEASPKQIVEALKEKGVEVSFGLASVVKYRKKGGKNTSAKKSKRTVTAKAKANSGVSMSEAIRQFIAKNPNAGPKDIQAGLKAEGTKVKLGLISAVKYSKAKKGGKKRRARTPVVHAAARAIPSSAVTFEQLVEVKRLADSLGGADQVRQALDALAQLQ